MYRPVCCTKLVVKSCTFKKPGKKSIQLPQTAEKRLFYSQKCPYCVLVVENACPTATRDSTSKSGNAACCAAAEMGDLLFRESLGVMIRVTCRQDILC